LTVIGEAAGKAYVSFDERQCALPKFAGLKVLEPMAD
jgi:hypothetical protein